MALSSLKKGFAGRAAAIGFGAMAAVTPLSYSFADDGRSQVTTASAAAAEVALVEDAGLTANQYAHSNPGIAVAVYLGTQSSVTPSQIQQILTREFRGADVSDPITFFFDQNDTPGTGVSYYYSGAVDGPFSLGNSRQAAVQTAETYNWRRSRGLLASVSYDQ